jgi:putative oxidoreductase
MNTGWLIMRIVFGVLMAGHGAQKLFGWLGGYGVSGTGGFFESLGFRPGRLFATLVGAAEFLGGVLIVLGLFGPIGPALILPVMVVALITVHLSHGLFAATNGIEVPLLYSAAAVALALAGPGAYSLDAALGIGAIWTQALQAVIPAAGLVAGLAALAIRRPAAVHVR